MQVNKRKCKKCLKIKDMDNFPFKNQKGFREERRLVCHNCSYGKSSWGPHVYDFLKEPKNNQLKIMKARLDELTIKKEGCWEWKGFIRPDGYTRMRFKGKSIGGHVFSWMIANKITEIQKTCILHRCDNRSCTNPAHLFSGTYSENMIDMVNKKRHPGIKLTVKEVRNIKRLLSEGLSCTLLANIYKVNWATINDIKCNKTWKHIKKDLIG